MSHATHNAVQRLSEDARKAFPDADYVIAVKLPADVSGKSTVTVYAGPGFDATPKTDLRGMNEIPANNGAAFQMLPGDRQMLQFIQPDATVTYCYNRPRWTWLVLSFTEL